MMADLHAEISGPVLASFHHKFAESKGDFLAILLGCVRVLDYSENSDLATSTEKSKTRVVVQKWVFVNVEDIVDFKTGMLKEDALTMFVDIIGMLKFKKSLKVDSSPSFMDRFVMKAVLDSCSGKHRPCLYLLVGEEVTCKTLNIKYNMVTFLLEYEKSCTEGPWSRRVPLLVPNLGTDHRVEYMKGAVGGSHSLKELLEGIPLNSCLLDVNKNFQSLNIRFRAGVDQVSRRVIELENCRASLEEEVVVMNKLLNDRLKQSSQMKSMKSLQGDLMAALLVGLDKPEEKIQVEEKMYSMKLVLSDDEEFMSD
jgi:hypothetical protein